jgi:serine/threonine-protein kinase
MYYESGVKYFWISFFTSLIVSAIVCFLIIAFLSPYISQKKAKVDVPNLKGMKEDQAFVVLRNKGLLLFVSEKKEDPNYEDGVVLDQEPLPGFSIEEGSLVKVTINVKLKTEILEEVIPDVRGQQLMTAKNRIEKAGYVVGKIEFKESDTYTKDCVINTDPAPGIKSTKGTVVNIIVSTAIVEITVPDLRRKSISSARSSLEKRGLKLGNIRYTTNIEFAFDIIISQQPPSGAKVNSGSPVDIVVNREGTY